MRTKWIVSLAALPAASIAAVLWAAEPTKEPAPKGAASKAAAIKDSVDGEQPDAEKSRIEKPAAEKSSKETAGKAVAKPAIAKVSAEMSPDEVAIRRNADRYVVAYEKQDAKGLAALWSPEAVYVNQQSGKRAEGREAIEREFAKLFEQSPPARLKVQVDSVRLVTPDVAIEDGRAIVLGDDGAPSESTYSAVHVKRDGQWLLDSVRETELPPPGTAAEHLQQLDWLVGEWVDADDEAVVHTRYHWTPNRAFLVQSFSVFVDDRLDMKGTQVIGWDPVAKQIRSWAFDSNGGFAEGVWEADGDRYVIRQRSTLPDGRQGSAINVIQKQDDDQFSYQSSARQVAGEMLPNVDEIIVVRYEADAEPADDDESAEAEDDGAGKKIELQPLEIAPPDHEPLELRIVPATPDYDDAPEQDDQPVQDNGEDE